MWGGFGFSPSAMIILSGLKGSFQPQPAIEPRICCWDFHVFAQSKLMIGRPKPLTERQLRFA